MWIIFIIWITATVSFLVGLWLGKRLTEQEYNSKPLEEKEEEDGNTHSWRSCHYRENKR